LPSTTLTKKRRFFPNKQRDDSGDGGGKSFLKNKHNNKPATQTQLISVNRGAIWPLMLCLQQNVCRFLFILVCCDPLLRGATTGW